MKKYFEIRRNLLVIIILGVILICGTAGYYVWCSYHPEIIIQVSEGATDKEGIKMEAPHIATSSKGIAEIASSIELEISNVVMQHEYLCEYIKNTYKNSDIELDIVVEENKILLHYHGNVTPYDGNVEPFEKDISCDFRAKADIVYK